jgi:hypothetical protein
MGKGVSEMFAPNDDGSIGSQRGRLNGFSVAYTRASDSLLHEGRGIGSRQEDSETRGALCVQDRKCPTTFEALLSNVLFTDISPEDIVVCKHSPTSADLCGSAPGYRVQLS